MIGAKRMFERGKGAASTILVLGVAGTVAIACATVSSGTAVNAIQWPAPVIPKFNIDSVTHDSVSNGAYALVGTVVDSSGRRIDGAQVSLTDSINGRHYNAWTDSLGGFGVGRVPPAHYQLVVKRLGFWPVTGTRDARMGAVDTLRAKLKYANMTLQSPGA
jgi:hypothetical protein